MTGKRRSLFGRINLASRFVLVVLLLLLFVQGAGFQTIRVAVDAHVESEVDQSLTVAYRIWNESLQRAHDRLFEAATVLAADFGFRSAVATGDAATISSALSNSADRIKASIAFLLGPDLAFRAASIASSTALREQFDTIIEDIGAARASHGEDKALISLFHGVPTQFVLIPVKAPRTIGYVLMGFTIDQSRLVELKRLTGIDVTLVSTDDAGQAASNNSTLPFAAADRLSQVRQDQTKLDIAGERYMLAYHELSLLGGEMRLYLARSLTRASAQLDELQITLAKITLIGMLVFGLGAVWSAHRITSPLVALTNDTRALGAGDFDIAVQGLDRADEIGTLSRGFDQMRRDIKVQREKILRLAYFDTLTGLPNRLKFIELIQAGLDGRRMLEQPLIVLTINMDRFKQVNDILGYAMGDRLLQSTAERIGALVRRDGDALARLGGDEFAVLLSRTDKAGATEMAQRIQHALHDPLDHDETSIDLSASIGFAVWPDDADDAETLVNRSQIAMYAAKARSEEIVEYARELDTAAPENLGLLSELRRAVSNGELRLYLQPKVDAASRDVIGAEGLIRWQHPDRGMIAPFKFVPFAEETGFVRQLTRWIFDEAARVWSDLQGERGDLRISINLSTRDLMDPKFADYLQSVLDAHCVPATGFCLEITESAIMDDPELAEETLRRLSRMGFRLSIDDFGTGYSSLGYLKRLPVDELKIDQSFVFGMLNNENDAIIVRSTIDLAHNLGLHVVAEGVETQEMYRQLLSQGCEEIQGYLFGKPMPVDAFARWRASYKPAAAGAA